MSLLLEALKHSFSPVKALRVEAELAIAQACGQPGFVKELLRLSVQGVPGHPGVDQAAALALKNSIRRNWVLGNQFDKDEREGGETSAEVVAAAAAAAKKQQVQVPEGDKQFLRESLFESLVLVQSNKPIARIISECIRQLTLKDFPQRWPQIIPQIMESFSSNDTTRVFSGLAALRKLLKALAIDISIGDDDEQQGRKGGGGKSSRDNFNTIVNTVLPLLRAMLQKILLPLLQTAGGEPNMTDNAIVAFTTGVDFDPTRHIPEAMFIASILKIFQTSIEKMLPKVMLTNIDQEAVPWYDLLDQILGMQMQEKFQQDMHVSNRETWPWWKVQRRAMEISCKLFYRYGNRSSVCMEKYNKHASFFCKSGHASKLLVRSMAMLHLHSLGRYLPKMLWLNCVSYVDTSIEPSATFKVLKESLHFLIEGIIFPVLKFNEDDAELWKDDPVEYARKHFDVSEEYLDPKESVSRFLSDLTRLRRDDTLETIVLVIFNVFAKFKQQGQPAHLAPEKDAAMKMLSSIATSLKGKRKVYIDDETGEVFVPKKQKQQQLDGADEFNEKDWEMKPSKFYKELETMLITFVLPDLVSSPIGYLRARACHVLSQFLDLEFRQPNSAAAIAAGIVQALRDPEIPVQADAAAALSPVFYQGNHDMLLYCKPNLKLIVGELLRIMQLIPVSDVVSGLNQLIERFPEDVTNFAEDLLKHLGISFYGYFDLSNKIAAEGADGLVEYEDEDDESGLAAINCLDTILSLLKACEEHPEIMAAAVTPMVPVLQIIIDPTNQLMDHLDFGLRILSLLVYHSPDNAVPDDLWKFVPLIFQCYDTWALDYIREFSLILEHYVNRDPAGLLKHKDAASGTSFVELIYAMCKRSYFHENSELVDKRACMILLCALLHVEPLRGAFDGAPLQDILLSFLFVPGWEKVKSEQKILLWLAGFESCLYYNAKMTLDILSNAKLVTPAFEVLFAHASLHGMLKEKKLAILALCAVLRIPLADLPVDLIPMMPTLITILSTLLFNHDLQMQDEAADRAGEGGDASEAKNDLTQGAIDQHGNYRTGAAVSGNMYRDAGGEDDEEEEQFEDDADLEEFNAVEKTLDFNEDEDAIDDEELAEMQKIHAKLAKIRNGGVTTGADVDNEDGGEFGDLEEEGDQENIWLEGGGDWDREEDEYSSPLDNFDECIVFQDTVNNVLSRNAEDKARFQTLILSLNPQVQQAIQEALLRASQRRQPGAATST